TRRVGVPVMYITNDCAECHGKPLETLPKVTWSCSYARRSQPTGNLESRTHLFGGGRVSRSAPVSLATQLCIRRFPHLPQFWCERRTPALLGVFADAIRTERSEEIGVSLPAYSVDARRRVGSAFL